MQISYNWLQDLLPDLTASPEEVADTLTMHSFETEVVKRWHISPDIKVVKILAIDPHPNADRLRLATVTDGQQEIQVVCGAPNIEVGQLVPYAPPGAEVLDADGQPFTIKEATIRGVTSPGMLNSARELGISDDHGGILTLPGTLPLGDTLLDHMPNDVILEADITPNRAHDCLSHLGIARELAALLRLTVKEPETQPLPGPAAKAAGFSLDIPDDHHTPRYAGYVLDQLTLEASPLWMQARLLAAGSRPINAIVDSTNYVLFETGQPSHAFDADKLLGPTISIRPGTSNDKLTILNGDTIAPTADDLVITSQDKPVALAGVMGGTNTEVGKGTRRLFLEVATFSNFSIQETARRHNLRSESSMRFAKGIDPNLVSFASARLLVLLQELCGAAIQGRLEHYPHPRSASAITFRPDRPQQLAGTDFDYDEMKDTFTRLRCAVDDATPVWLVTPPTDRLDLVGEHDLVEEIIRVTGLESIPVPDIATLTPAQPQPLPPTVYWREVVRDFLVERGFTETYNQSFEPAGYARLLDLDEEPIQLVNPPAPELNNLRRRLMPGLLANLATNRDDFHKKFSRQEKALFEIGHVYQAGDDGKVPGVIEDVHVAGVLVGTQQDAASLIDDIRQLLQTEVLSVIYLDQLPDRIQKKVKYRQPIAAFELNLTELIKHAPLPPAQTMPTLDQLTAPEDTRQFQPFSRYPSVLRDIAFLVDPSVTVEQAQEVIERAGGDLVLDTDLFDEFEPTGENRKNLAFHIEYQAPDRTLTDADIDPVHKKIEAAIKKELQADIR